MRNDPLPQRPSNGVESLDRGLRLLQLLRDDGSVRVSDAAMHLGTARSTAHRLLSTLVYRGFAVIDDDHVYRPGPSMDVGTARLAWIKELRRICHPHLTVLARRAGQSANLMVRTGVRVRFLETVEASTARRTRDRQGIVMPAARASGGKALLATLTDEELTALYRAATTDDQLSDGELSSLLRELHSVRRNGFAVNRGETERDVAAVGAAIESADGAEIGAFSVSVQSDLLTGDLQQRLIDLVLQARAEISRDIRASDLHADAAPFR
ncbi:IclR family transcriptional regulator [Microbacterium aoyamense]|uniref:IclR family transcriptional regulator n=1 Tax=Microbacterium aoyamense TaxID=344166 RepID=A0ABP5B884_9MICO|nr:IclR family transcriptional regulator [Microbacterium aoyamense]